MNFEKNSIGYIVTNDLKEIKKDRDNLLEELKSKVRRDKDVDFMIETILIGNALIAELESLIERSSKSK